MRCGNKNAALELRVFIYYYYVLQLLGFQGKIKPVWKLNINVLEPSLEIISNYLQVMQFKEDNIYRYILLKSRSKLLGYYFVLMLGTATITRILLRNYGDCKQTVS